MDTSVTRLGQISESVENLGKAVACLGDLIKKVEERLQRVLRDPFPEPEQGTTEYKEEEKVQLAHEIAGLTDALIGQRVFLNSILDRLEL